MGLSKAFGVNGIPSLVLLDSEANGRNTITTSGRSFVMENQVEDFPRSWAPKPYADLTKTAECKGSSINDEKALCVFVHQLEDKNVDGLKALPPKMKRRTRSSSTRRRTRASPSRWSDCVTSSRRRARRH